MSKYSSAAEQLHDFDQHSVKERAPLKLVDQTVENSQSRENINKIKTEIQEMLSGAKGKVSDRLLQNYKRQINQVGNNNIPTLINLKYSLGKEIKERTDRFQQYANKLLDQKEHFRPKSIEKYLDEFTDLSTEAEQQKWLELFDKTELPDHKKFTDQFKAFSEDRQQKNRVLFYNGSRKEKAELIESMKGDLRRECDSAIDNSPSCEAMKQSTKHYLSSPTTTVQAREEELKNLKENSKTEKDYNTAYSNIPINLRRVIDKNFKEIYLTHIKPKIKYDYKGRSAPEKFTELTMTEKEIFLKTYFPDNKKQLEKEANADKDLIDGYEQKLTAAEKSKILSPNTIKLYRRWFLKELQTKGRKKAEEIIAKFDDADENRKRKDLLTKFENFVSKFEKEKKLTPAEKDKRQKEFYEASYTKRLHIVEKLEKGILTEVGKKENEPAEKKGTEKTELIAKTPQQKKIIELKAAADHCMYNELWEKAADHYRETLILDPKDEEAEMRLRSLYQKIGQTWPKNGVAGLKEEKDTKEESKESEDSLDLDPKKIETTLEDVLSSASIKEQLKSVTLIKLLSTLAYNSERRHLGITKVQNRTESLDTRQREIHEELGEATNDATILTKKEGKVEAKTVERVNLKRLSAQKDPDSTMQAKRLREELKPIQYDDKEIAKGKDELQMVDDEGRVLNGDMGKAEATKQEDNLHNEIISRMIVKLGISSQDVKKIVNFSTMMKKDLEQRNLSAELS